MPQERSVYQAAFETLLHAVDTIQLAANGFRAVSNYTRIKILPAEPSGLIFRIYNSILTPHYTLGLLNGLRRPAATRMGAALSTLPRPRSRSTSV